MVLWAQPTKPGSGNTQKKKRGHRAPPMVTHGSPGISSPCHPHLPSAGFPGEHLSLSLALVITEGRVEQNWSGQGSRKCASHWQSPEVRTQNCKQEFLTSTCDSHSRWGPGLSQVRGPSRQSRAWEAGSHPSSFTGSTNLWWTSSNGSIRP